MIQNRIAFESEKLTPSNLFQEIKKFVDELNELVKDKASEGIIFLNGHTIGFHDESKLHGCITNSSDRFLNVQLVGVFSEPDAASYIVKRVAIYALLSHGLSSRFKIKRPTKGGPGFSIWKKEYVKRNR